MTCFKTMIKIHYVYDKYVSMYHFIPWSAFIVQMKCINSSNKIKQFRGNVIDFHKEKIIYYTTKMSNMKRIVRYFKKDPARVFFVLIAILLVLFYGGFILIGIIL